MISLNHAVVTSDPCSGQSVVSKAILIYILLLLISDDCRVSLI